MEAEEGKRVSINFICKLEDGTIRVTARIRAKMGNKVFDLLPDVGNLIFKRLLH